MIFEFGNFRLDSATRVLACDGVPVTLNRRCFDVLLYLLQHPGRPVSKDELLQNVWPDAHVEENNLTQSISSLRRSMEKAQGENGYIVTLPGVGYQFTAPVSRVGETAMTHETGLATETAPGGFVLTQQTLTTTVVTEERSWFSRGTALAGCLALLAVLAGISAYVWKRAHRPVHLHKVVVADFGNTTGDATFDRVLRRALEIDLEQSPYLDVMGEKDGSETLTRMGKSSDTPITAAIAREICLRTDREVALTGNISTVGLNYLVTLDATDCNTGAKLGGAKAEAKTKEAVMPALDTVAEQVRSRLGESPASVRNFDVPLDSVATPSFDALKAYSTAVNMELRGNEGPEVEALYKRAIELDPNFAMAYGALGVMYENLSENQLAVQTLKKAYDLSRNGSAMEKLTIEAHYSVFSDMPHAMQVYRTLAATYPLDWTPWQNLANDYNELGETSQAIDAGEHAMKLEPDRASIYNVLIRAYRTAGRYDDALRLGQEAVRRGLDNDMIHAFLYAAALDSHEKDAIDRETKYGQLHGGWYFVYERAQTEDSAGEVSKANESFETSREIALREDLPETADSILTDQAQAQYDIGEPEQARATMARITKSDPNDPDQALLHAELGDTAYAESFIAANEHDTTNIILDTVALPRIRAVLFLRKHQPKEAIAALEPARLYAKREYNALTERALAYLQLSQPVEAATEFQTILASEPGSDSSNNLYNMAYLGLARAYVAQGDIAKARAEYAAFLKAWANADSNATALRQATAEEAHLARLPASN